MSPVVKRFGTDKTSVRHTVTKKVNGFAALAGRLRFYTRVEATLDAAATMATSPTSTAPPTVMSSRLRMACFQPDGMKRASPALCTQLSKGHLIGFGLDMFTEMLTPASTDAKLSLQISYGASGSVLDLPLLTPSSGSNSVELT